jgi:nucleotide-binding universal stress UspA family protein
MPAKILVPVDGSDKDERSFPIAVNFAYLADADLHLVRVISPATDVASRVEGGSNRLDREQAELSIRSAANRLRPAVRGSVTWEVIDAPDAAAALLGCIAQVTPVLVVMATRAPGPVGRAIYGSVADEIVRESSRPVILVPPGAEFLHGKDVHLRRVLVPLDESPAAREVLTLLLAFPRVNELELVLLEVVSPDRDHTEAKAATDRLEAVADRTRAHGVAVEVRVVEANAPIDVIVGAVRQELVDVIAMSTRGAGGLERALLGSVATGVVRRSEVPVILLASGHRDA